MTPDEAQRLACAAHQLRPDWPVKSLATFLRKHYEDRAYLDVGVALAAIALDPATETPARMLEEQGPWWVAAAAAIRGIRGPGQAPPRGSHNVQCVDHPEHVHPCQLCVDEKQGGPPPEYLAAKKKLEKAARLAAKPAAACDAFPRAERDAAHVDVVRAALAAVESSAGED